MQSWMKPGVPTQQIDVLLFDAFSALCLANTVEPLRAANQLAGRKVYDWRFLTIDGAPALSSSGMEVTAHARLSDCTGDLLIAIPSYDFLRHATVDVSRALRSARGRYGVLAGFDTGAWLLAAAGLLDGRRATIHWEELSRFAETFPEVQAERERQIIDGDRITCSGALAALETMLDLIGQQHGQALRLEVATLFMSTEASSDQGAIVARNRIVGRAIAIMQANLETPLTIGAVAKQIGRSQRDLEMRMQADLGATPQAVYRRLRLIQARKLVLETTVGVAEIAQRCGYENPSALTRAFRAEFGATPRAMRSELL